MTNYIYIATSLDGFIATEGGGLDWLMDLPNPEGSDYGFAEFMNSIDAIVMGRKTFEVVHTFNEWPYTKPVFVLSNTLVTLPKKYEGRAELIKGDPASIVKDLNDRGFHDLYIDGGKVIQAFLDQDLIDEMIITRVSVLLGSGIPLFGNIVGPLKFEHKETIIHTRDLVKGHYIRKRE